MREPTDNQTAYGPEQDREPPTSGVQTGWDTSERGRDPGEDDTDHRREAEQAHGGSMAPGVVDATGKRVSDSPPTGQHE
jgi:hypothetical protein